MLIAGSGSLHVDELKSTIAEFGHEIRSRVHWELNFPAEKKAIIFNSLDLFVLPSNNESFGIVFLEAWSCRKPVIGAAIGAVRDVISENEDGLIIEINSEVSLVDKVSTLIENLALRHTMGEKGFAKVKENYTWDIITSRLRECYQRSLNTSVKTKVPQSLNA